jgi:hypothetical protein
MWRSLYLNVVVYYVILIGISVAIWAQIYTAQFLEYDQNYANLLSAFILSVFALTGLTVLWFKKKAFVKSHMWQTILYLILASPFTIALVIINYSVIFGVLLKN